jgi:glycogen synthase
VGCITRLVPQKGVHLIRHSIYRTLERGGQFILLGSSPIPHIQVWLTLRRAHKYILSNFLTRDGFKFSIQTMVVTIFTLVVYSMSLKELHANLIITLKFDWC